MNQSLHPVANPLPGAGLWWETRASLAFVERNLYLVRRYWHLELAFLIFNVASAMSVLYIGEAQMQASGGGTQEGQLDLVLYLGIGTVVWAYLRAVFANVGEMVAWERWEGTIEYTFMAPLSRAMHLAGQGVFAVAYGLIRALFLYVVCAFVFFDLSTPDANYLAALVVLVVSSISFIGIGMMMSVLPLISPEKGTQLGFVAQGTLLVVSGVYYPVEVLPEWMQAIATISPATYALDGIREAILDGQGLTAMWDELWPLLIIGAVSVPLGLWIFSRGERYAKRHGKLKRSG
jgi:ABC-2 type transport system permease protein